MAKSLDSVSKKKPQDEFGIRLSEINRQQKEDGQKNNLRHIPLTAITLNSKNDKFNRFDTDEDIKALCESIMERGLYSPLVVVAEAGKYRLLSGERRYKAIKIIPEHKRNELFPLGIPAVVYTDLSGVRDDIILCEANSLSRSYDNLGQRLEFLQWLVELYEIDTPSTSQEILKSTMKERIKAALHISTTQASILFRYTKLIPEWQELVKDGTVKLENLGSIGNNDSADQLFLKKVFDKCGRVDKKAISLLAKQKKQKENSIRYTKSSASKRGVSEQLIQDEINGKLAKLSVLHNAEKLQYIQSMGESTKSTPQSAQNTPNQQEITRLLQNIKKSNKRLNTLLKGDIEVSELTEKITETLQNVTSLLKEKGIIE